MENAIDPGPGRPKARAERLRVRTTPPGLWLVRGCPTSEDAPLAAADLIALARAARATAPAGTAGEPAEPARGRARSIPES
ncbi:hypothetical protein MKK75_34905 [Methylobacterium sp. J-030]|uniref:hypothetical protein n=1 Tax=Methylobacterium sp. J-030 TaxID=2836627 RepID=UPI001FBC13AB|nr:hypothetical protein [Methylobacterium sp. J-030]MCJ2073923.1 hypothetical protein [Methylobacterium sp. J-030]